jgi:hypothetical protein
MLGEPPGAGDANTSEVLGVEPGTGAGGTGWAQHRRELGEVLGVTRATPEPQLARSQGLNQARHLDRDECSETTREMSTRIDTGEELGIVQLEPAH